MYLLIQDYLSTRRMIMFEGDDATEVYLAIHVVYQVCRLMQMHVWTVIGLIDVLKLCSDQFSYTPLLSAIEMNCVHKL